MASNPALMKEWEFLQRELAEVKCLSTSFKNRQYVEKYRAKGVTCEHATVERATSQQHHLSGGGALALAVRRGKVLLRNRREFRTSSHLLAKDLFLHREVEMRLT